VSSPDTGDAALVEALRRGDEQGFRWLVDRYHGSMLRVARAYVGSRESAEDVVQETFVAIIEGIDRFEGRASLKTWVFRILVNRAKTRGERDARTVPMGSLTTEVEGDEPAVDPDRFVASGRGAGCWGSPPSSGHLPEAAALAAEAGQQMLAAIDALPPAQRTVITLRDVQGLSAQEVCDLLEVSEVNQRVLLHRARSKTRAALERYLDEEHARG
jgi:RNA polymerase sigma-70 factor (ECF subfamily)